VIRPLGSKGSSHFRKIMSSNGVNVKDSGAIPPGTAGEERKQYGGTVSSIFLNSLMFETHTAVLLTFSPTYGVEEYRAKEREREREGKRENA